ncbi:MAG: hypothetical protein QM736_15950 [Vicinamibacterales bacterium]
MEMFRWMIFDAIEIERSTASERICCSARLVSSWICRSAFRIDPLGFRLGLLTDLFTEAIGVRTALRDDGLGFRPCFAEDLGRFLLEPLQFQLRRLRIVQRLADALLPGVQRLEQRLPGELRQQRQQHEEREDGPDEEARIGLDQRVVHRFDLLQVSGGRTTRVRRTWLLLQEDDQQREHFGENRDAFEQEQRQVHRTGDLVRRRGLPGDPFGCASRELADAETGANHNQAQAQCHTEERNCITFHDVSLLRVE